MSGYESDQRGRSGAQDDPQSELASALSSPMSDHRVAANRGKDERREAHNRRKPGADALCPCQVASGGRERPWTREWNAGVDLPECLPHRASERSSVGC